MRNLQYKYAFALALAVLCFAAQAQAQTPEQQAEAKRRKVKYVTKSYGTVEVKTTSGGYPVLIDGQPAGTTQQNVKMVKELSPGQHTVEVLFPNGRRHTQVVNVVPGKSNCICLAYRAIPPRPCPYPVSVSAPDSVVDGDIITFTSDVAYGGTSALNYTWTVSPAGAKIMSGAGTPTITVDTTGLGNQRVTAIPVVDDGSGDRNCRQMAQATTPVTPLETPKPPPVFDEIPRLKRDDLKARLDNLAIELQNTPGAQGYIIFYDSPETRPNEAARYAAFAKSYLVNQRGIEASRIVVVNGGMRRRELYQVFIVPPGAVAPTPTPDAGLQPNVGSGPVPAPQPGSRPRRSRRDE